MNNADFSSVRPAAKYEFSRFDTLMAWCAILLGYFIIRVLPVWNKPAGAALLLLALYTISFVWLKKSGVRPDARSLVFAFVGILYLPVFILNNKGEISVLLFLAELLVWIYFIYSATGNRMEDRIGQLFFFDAVKAAFVMPFVSFSALAGAAVGGKAGRTKKLAVNILWVLLGLVAAVIPTMIIMMLLSYDANFTAMVERLFDFDAEWLIERIFTLIFGLPLAFYGFALFISSRSRKLTDKMTREQCSRGIEKVRFLPAAFVYAVMTPVLLTYAVFFVSQWSYYMSAFTGVLPEGMIYSKYARDGFFNLCVVAALNAIALLIVNALVRRRGSVEKIFLKVYSILTALFTLILIATALSKMALYIGAYGLTQKRVLVSWFMIFMAAGFIFVIIAQLWRKFRFNPALLITGAVLFGALAYSNIDARIANYNAAAYLDGQLDWVDVEEIYDMGDAGIPALLRLEKEAKDGETAAAAKEKIIEYIDIQVKKEDNGSIFSFNVRHARAVRLLEDSGYLIGDK